MKYCTNCGTEMEIHLTTCPSCETEQMMNDAEANKVMGILAYLLFFVPLLTGAYKESEFVKFHTNQGTVLAIIGIVSGLVSSILMNLFWGFFLVGSLISLAVSLWGIGIMVFSVLGIVSAVQGKNEPLPLIGGIKLIK